MRLLEAFLGVGAVFIILTALNMVYLFMSRYITNFKKIQIGFKWLDKPVFRKKSFTISQQKNPDGRRG